MYSDVVNCETIDRLPTPTSPTTTTFNSDTSLLVVDELLPLMMMLFSSNDDEDEVWCCLRLNESPRFFTPREDVENDRTRI